MKVVTSLILCQDAIQACAAVIVEDKRAVLRWLCHRVASLQHCACALAILLLCGCAASGVASTLFASRQRMWCACTCKSCIRWVAGRAPAWLQRKAVWIEDPGWQAVLVHATFALCPRIKAGSHAPAPRRSIRINQLQL